MSQTRISFDGTRVVIHAGTHPLDAAKVRSIPNRRYLKREAVWKAPATLNVLLYIRGAWTDAAWTNEAQEALIHAQLRAAERADIIEAKGEGIDLSILDGMEFSTDPYQHQRNALAVALPTDAFAFLMDQGTGKTWVNIQWLLAKWRANKIDGAVITVPNSVKRQWQVQIMQHGANAEHNIGIWYSSATAPQRKAEDKWADGLDQDAFHWLIVNPEAWAMPRFLDYALQLMGMKRMALTLDESTRFKNRTAQRTKNVMKARRYAPVASIMSGTPIIKSPMDAFSQFNFLDQDILGFDNFYSFRAHYGIMGGYKGKQVVAFKNESHLEHAIKSASFRVTKDECLDLPPKVGGVTDPNGPQYREVEMVPKQRAEYKRMQKELKALLDDVCDTCYGAGMIFLDVPTEEGHVVAECKKCDGPVDKVQVTIALTQVLRMQQITSGFITDTKEAGEEQLLHWFTDKPPKIMELMDIIEDGGDQSMIHWSTFRPEIAFIEQELSCREIQYVSIHGGVAMPDRERAQDVFQSGDVQHTVANPAAAGIGLDLWRASIANYVSNSRKTEDRVQSEDRCHRIGSEIHDSVLYNDIVVPQTIDTKIVRDLRGDTDRSRRIMGDAIGNLIKELI